MQNETQRSESRCAEETWFQRHLPQPGHVGRVQYLWKSHSAKLGPGNGRSLSCCSKDVGTRKSLGICTLPSERSKHISIASFCVSESRVASSGLSSRLCSIGGNYGWRESNPSRAQRRRTPHHPMRSRGLQEPGDRRFARDQRARGENLFALDHRTSWDCGTESRALWYEARQPRAGLSHLSFVGALCITPALREGGFWRRWPALGSGRLGETAGAGLTVWRHSFVGISATEFEEIAEAVWPDP